MNIFCFSVSGILSATMANTVNSLLYVTKKVKNGAGHYPASTNSSSAVDMNPLIRLDFLKDLGRLINLFVLQELAYQKYKNL